MTEHSVGMTKLKYFIAKRIMRLSKDFSLEQKLSHLFRYTNYFETFKGKNFENRDSKGKEIGINEFSFNKFDFHFGSSEYILLSDYVLFHIREKTC